MVRNLYSITPPQIRNISLIFDSQLSKNHKPLLLRKIDQANRGNDRHTVKTKYYPSQLDLVGIP